MKLTGVYTTAGARLSAKILAGSCDLQLTRAVAGSGASGETAALLDQPQQTLELGDITRKDNTVTAEAVLRSAESDHGYTLTQVGLYAADPEAGEILYRVYTVDQGILISPDCSLTAVFYLSDTVLSTTAAAVQVSSAGVMLRSDGESMIRSLHFYDPDGSETITCAAEDLPQILQQLPDIIDHDITVSITGTAVPGNLIIEDLAGPGRLYLSAQSALTVGGYIRISHCRLGLLELINISPNGTTLLNTGDPRGLDSAVCVLDSDLVKITNCIVPAPAEAQTNCGFYFSNSRVVINKIEAPNRYFAVHVTNLSRMHMRNIYVGTFAKDCYAGMCIDECASATFVKTAASADWGTSRYTIVASGGTSASGGSSVTYPTD